MAKGYITVKEGEEISDIAINHVVALSLYDCSVTVSTIHYGYIQKFDTPAAAKEARDAWRAQIWPQAAKKTPKKTPYIDRAPG